MHNRKIDLYIFTTSILAILGSIVLLSIIEAFFTFINELADLNTTDYTMSQLLGYLAYDTPLRVHRILPMGLLLGALLGLGNLASYNELTIIRAAGLSKFRLLWGTIFAIILFSLIGLLLGEYVVPETSRIAENYQSKGKAYSNQKGFWAISDNKIINVKSFTEGNLENISIYTTNDNEILNTVTAKRAILKQKDWVMPTAIKLSFQENRIMPSILSSFVFPELVDDRVLDALATKPENLSMLNLWRFIGYLEHNGLDSSEYRLAFWSKVFSPIMNLMMLVIAAPLVFSQQRQQSLGARIFIGIIIGLLIYLATQMLSHAILILGYPPIFGAIFPLLIAGLISFILFKIVASS